MKLAAIRSCQFAATLCLVDGKTQYTVRFLLVSVLAGKWQLRIGSQFHLFAILYNVLQCVLCLGRSYKITADFRKWNREEHVEI